jgi:cytoskeleton protein RodZ
VAVRASEHRRVGARLRRARIKRGIELVQASRGTRIKPRYLEALERDAPLEEFPAPVYARAFLREYAQWLGLDPKPLVESFVDEHPQHETPLVLPAPVQKAPGRWSRRILPAMSIAVLVTLLILSIRTGTPPRAPLSAIPSPASQRPAIEATATVPEPSTRGILLAVSVVEGPSWIRVTSDGRMVAQTTMRPGSVDTFKANRRLDVWLGNAGAARLTLNGRSIAIPVSADVHRASFIRQKSRIRIVPYVPT